jgi:hypothetical protein
MSTPVAVSFAALLVEQSTLKVSRVACFLKEADVSGQFHPSTSVPALLLPNVYHSIFAGYAFRLSRSSCLRSSTHGAVRRQSVHLLSAELRGTTPPTLPGYIVHD